MINAELFSQSYFFQAPATSACDPILSYMVNFNAAENQKEFVFDSFSKYNGGVTFYGSTSLKVVVADNPSTVGSCKWQLLAAVVNNNAPGSEWKTLTSYGLGASAIKPEIDILNVRIDNACHTPQNTDWQTFTGDSTTISIINVPGSTVNSPNGTITCTGTEVNGIGTYLGPDYTEYTFSVDYKITPGLIGYAPGRYELQLVFCLREY